MRLGAMVDELRGLDPDALTDSELAELLVSLTDLREAAEATQLRTMGAFEGRQVHKADGAYTAASWLRARSHLSTTEANTTGRTMEAFAEAEAEILHQGRPVLRRRDRVDHALVGTTRRPRRSRTQIVGRLRDRPRQDV